MSVDYVSGLQETSGEQNEESTAHKTCEEIPDEAKSASIGTDKEFKHKIVWPNVIGFLLLHLAGLYGLYLIFAGFVQFKSIVYFIALVHISLEGIALGAHRLYTHRAYKATTSLKVVLIIMQTISGQNSMWEWVRDHRQHHKYSDTDADPHNANHGLFFSHIGWLMSRKHPKVIEYGKKIDMSDLEADKLVMFQKNYFFQVYFVVGFLIPTLIPMYLWNESFSVCFFTLYAAKNITELNITWTLNSISHAYGYKPYDKTIRPQESILIALITSGEGWHNFHHTFPWDYRNGEFGMIFNQSAVYIDLLARLGFAKDLRSASPNMVESYQTRKGDGSYTDINNRPYLERFLILCKKLINASVNKFQIKEL